MTEVPPDIADLAREVAASDAQFSSLPLQQTISAVGGWRVYYHRLNPEGLPWCVSPDAGGWELVVSTVEITAPSHTVYERKATPDDEDGRPSAWIAASGRLTVGTDGRAVIAPAEDA